MPPISELPSQHLTEPVKGKSPLYRLVEKCLDNPITGIIFSCNLKSSAKDKRTLCPQASDDAQKLVKTEARASMPVHFSSGEGSAPYSFAIEQGIYYALRRGLIAEENGHAIATDNGRQYLADLPK